MSNFTITADSTPLYDGWGWDSYWDIYDWQKWFEELEKKYGMGEAGKKWLDAWNKQGTGANPLWAWEMSKIKTWAISKGLWSNKSGYSGIKQADEAYVPPPIANQGQVITTTNPTTGQSEQSQVGVQPTYEKLQQDAEAKKKENLKKAMPILFGGGIITLGLVVTYIVLKIKTKGK